MSIESDKAAFMARFRGVPAHVVASAMNGVTSGINWRGCSKGHIAERWAIVTQPDAGTSQKNGYGNLPSVTLDQIAAAVERELNPRVPRG